MTTFRSMVFRCAALWLTTLCATATFGQRPAHQVIGADELAGVHVFGLAQDTRGRLWLATNTGLLAYDGHAFEPVPRSDGATGSLFELKLDHEGRLHGCDLNGTILRVERDTLRPVFTVPDSLLRDRLHYDFDDRNRLVFCSKDYRLVEEDGGLRFLFPAFSPNVLARTDSGALVLLDEEGRRMGLFADDHLTVVDTLPFAADRPFVVDDRLVLTMRTDVRPDLFTPDEDGLWHRLPISDPDVAGDEMIEPLLLDDSLVAFVFKTKGLTLYHTTGRRLHAAPRILTRYRISAHLRDRSGDLWLGTLGKGLLRIPEIRIVDYSDHPLLADDDLRAITSDGRGTIYVGGVGGTVYRIDTAGVSMLLETSAEIEHLHVDHATDRLFIDRTVLDLASGRIRRTNASSVKDIVPIGADRVAYATNIGVAMASFPPGETDVLVDFLTDDRTLCLAIDTARNAIWAGTTAGLQLIRDETVRIVNGSDGPIRAHDLQIVDGEVWVATPSNGVLVIDGDLQVRSVLDTADRAIASVRHLRVSDSTVVLATDDGLHVHDRRTGRWRRITVGDGLRSERILDVEVVGHHAWLVFPDGLQRVPLWPFDETEPPAPTIFWKSILVNGEPMDTLSTRPLRHTQNQVELRFASPAFGQADRVSYRYRLDGMDDDWTNAPLTDNAVAYRSLPPGRYTFRVQAVHEDGRGSPVLAHAFRIRPPFWATWWFLAACALVIGGVTALFFTVRMRAMRRQLTLEKQLRISEIKAINAQMNPHFVFNALNSIQDFIMLQDVRSANKYLGLFADLMRDTLDHSSQHLVTLHQEVELLERYLAIERLRFGNDFQATVSCTLDEGVTHERQVPSMLVQPYVENAIKHGLHHKRGPKRLDVRFFLDGDVLVCEVEDDGVGRARSRDINARRARRHASFSTEANARRIDLLRESTNTRIELDIVDLEEDGSPTGTRVVLRFHPRHGR